MSETETEIGEVIPDDYQARVERLLGMIENDPAVRDRMLCEIYIGFMEMDRAMRSVALNGGPMAMLKALMGRGNNGESES